jgi:hypothetical protein
MLPILVLKVKGFVIGPVPNFLGSNETFVKYVSSSSSDFIKEGFVQPQPAEVLFILNFPLNLKLQSNISLDVLSP